jgi:hypothetical protein
MKREDRVGTQRWQVIVPEKILFYFVKIFLDLRKAIDEGEGMRAIEENHQLLRLRQFLSLPCI